MPADTAAHDPALAALLGSLTPSDAALPTLLLRARGGECLRAAGAGHWLCEQGFRPQYDRLQRAGLDVRAEVDAGLRVRHIVLLPPRSRDETRLLLARAASMLEPGGRLRVSVANNAGAGAVATDLTRLFGAPVATSRHKCRVLCSAPFAGVVDPAAAEQWAALDAVRDIGDGWLSRPGLFAWDRIDTASALLAAELPATLAGEAADLGAGWGWLGATLAARAPGITRIDLYEAEARALAPARANLARVLAARGRGDGEAIWHDVTAGLPRRYDVIVSNPPFHVDRADDPELGRRFIRVAAAALHAHGRAWFVANRHLPYEATLAECFAHHRCVVTGDGFKVFEAKEPRR